MLAVQLLRAIASSSRLRRNPQPLRYDVRRECLPADASGAVGIFVRRPWRTIALSAFAGPHPAFDGSSRNPRVQPSAAQFGLLDAFVSSLLQTRVQKVCTPLALTIGKAQPLGGIGGLFL